MHKEKSQNTIEDILADSVIVAAHPDDEILWFSSIIEKVKQVIVCYIHQESKPVWSKGRTEVLANYPLSHMRSINLHLSDIFDWGDWRNPCITPFGMKISKKGVNRYKYEDNYRILKNELSEIIRPYAHVFTHNPWGEYGHEEHVQVFRVVETLQSQMGFTLWVSNYVSNRSMPLMVNSLEKIDYGHFSKPTNKKLAAQIKNLYHQHGCWTWYSNFKWSEEDSFLKVSSAGNHKQETGRSFPLTFIDVGDESSASPFIKDTCILSKGMNRIRNRFFRSHAR